MDAFGVGERREGWRVDLSIALFRLARTQKEHTLAITFKANARRHSAGQHTGVSNRTHAYAAKRETSTFHPRMDLLKNDHTSLHGHVSRTFGRMLRTFQSEFRPSTKSQETHQTYTEIIPCHAGS
jgi:hypothetical protein